MISFDGIDIKSIADVRIEDIRVSPIQYSPVVRPRPVKGGALFIRNHCGERTVTITFALLDQDQIHRQAAIDAIRAWAKSDREYRIDIQGHPDKYLKGVCTAKPDPSLRQWWESKLRIVFTCYSDPYWNSIAEKQASCGSDFTVLGDAPPLMRIERTLAAQATNQSYSLDGKTITFSQIPAGNMVIDLGDQTAFVGSTDIMQYYNVNSRFLIPRVGTMNITGSGTVKYRERWE